MLLCLVLFTTETPLLKHSHKLITSNSIETIQPFLIYWFNNSNLEFIIYISLCKIMFDMALQTSLFLFEKYELFF